MEQCQKIKMLEIPCSKHVGNNKFMEQIEKKKKFTQHQEDVVENSEEGDKERVLKKPETHGIAHWKEERGKQCVTYLMNLNKWMIELAIV